MRTSVRLLLLKRLMNSCTNIAMMGTYSRMPNPFQLRAARPRKTPAMIAGTRYFLEPSSDASSPLTALTMKSDMRATMNAARAYSVPLENTDVEIARGRNAKISAATTPILRS